MVEATDVNVDELRRRARRRLVGAIVLALAAAVFVPMLLESDPKPLGEDVAVKIPPVDEGKFVNRLNEKAPAAPAKAFVPKSEGAKSEPAKSETARSEPVKVEPKPPAAPAKEAAPAPVAPAPVAPPKRSLNEAEQKVVGAAATPLTPSAPTVKSEPAPAAAAASAPTAAPPSAPTQANASAVSANNDSAAAGLSVQLAAFADDKGANSLAAKLKKAGYPAYTEPLATSKGTLWRVRVGPYRTRDAALASRDKLKGEGYSGIVAPAK